MKLTNSVSFFLAIIISIALIGCAGKGKPDTTPDPAKAEESAAAKARADYLLRLEAAGCVGNKAKLDKPTGDYRMMLQDKYGFLMSPDKYGQEKKIFERCPSVEAMDKYFEVFWSIRDPNPLTPENEYKDIIDERILDIKNEILFQDPEIAGTIFGANGGLRGDLAHVYLLRGEPSFKIKTTGNMNRLADLMVWAYFDLNQKPLFVFLFYNRGDGFRVFRRHAVMDSYEQFKETLREISKTFPNTDEEYMEVYRELQMADDQGIFRFALRQFSYYSDINIEKVLAPPTPEAITAKALQPRILGIVSIPEGVKMLENSYFASLAARLRLIKDADGNYGLQLLIRPSDFDWEDKGNVVESKLDLVITATNGRTREQKQFFSGPTLTLPSARYASDKDLYTPLTLSGLKNYSKDNPDMTFPEFVRTFSPGEYELKVKLLDQRTQKQLVLFGRIEIP